MFYHQNLSLSSGLLPSAFLTVNSIWCFYLFHACFMPHTSHPSWFEPEVYCKIGNDSLCVQLSVFCLPTFQNGTGNKLISYCGSWHLTVLWFFEGFFFKVFWVSRYQFDQTSSICLWFDCHLTLIIINQYSCNMFLVILTTEFISMICSFMIFVTNCTVHVWWGLRQ